MTLHRKLAFGYSLLLLGAASLNYIPGVTREDGTVLGVFALDLFDDALHLASALWALAAALTSARASRIFLLAFGALYMGDGVLGLVTGSGYLDLGIFKYGMQDFPLGFRVMANLPHVGLGLSALAAGLFGGERR